MDSTLQTRPQHRMVGVPCCTIRNLFLELFRSRRSSTIFHISYQEGFLASPSSTTIHDQRDGSDPKQPIFRPYQI